MPGTFSEFVHDDLYCPTLRVVSDALVAFLLHGAARDTDPSQAAAGAPPAGRPGSAPPPEPDGA